MNSKQTASTRSRLSLLLLFGIFAAPVVLAWLVFYVFPDWRPSGSSNHGELIEPVRPLPPFKLTAQDGQALDQAALRGKWTQVFLHQGDCDDNCVRQLYTMRQVRLAQGKNIDRLQRLMLWALPDAGDTRAAELAKIYPGLIIAPVEATAQQELLQMFVLDGQAPLRAGRHYLVDPLGNLMMYYEAETEPRGMIKDLEKLLKWSGLG